MSLDALSGVAYGPEAIVLGLVAAGAAAVNWTVPISLAIAVLLVVLAVSYRQVIAAHPDGGGAYALAKKDLGRWPVSCVGGCVHCSTFLRAAWGRGPLHYLTVVAA